MLMLMLRRYRWLTSITLILLFVVLHSLRAQEAWTAWVYQAEAGQLLRLDSSGDVVATQRIITPESDSLPETVIVSPTGSEAAYITQAQAGFVQHLNLLHLDDGSLLPPIPIDMPDDALYLDDFFALTDAAFSQDGTNLIYTEIVGGMGWSLHVLDTDSGDITHTLTMQDDIVAAFSPLHGGVVPIVQSVHDDSVTFTIDSGLPITKRSYTWFYRGAILTETVAAPSLQAAVFPATGDIMNPLSDWRFPAEMESFKYNFQQQNSLHVYELREQERYPFFTASDLHFRRVWFVQGGAAVVGEASLDAIHSVWVIIGRDGTEWRRLPVAGYDIRGTPDGFVYAARVNDSTALVQVNTRTLASAGDTVWLGEGNWRVVWAGPNTNAELASWVPLADSLQDPSGVPSIASTPTQMPPVLPFRAVGMAVQIYTEDDEYLNLRNAPTTKGDVLALLESGTQGIITDGPIEADGYRWWSIRVGSRTGWVVEALPNVLTLIPQQFIPEATEEPELK